MQHKKAINSSTVTTEVKSSYHMVQKVQQNQKVCMHLITNTEKSKFKILQNKLIATQYQRSNLHENAYSEDICLIVAAILKLQYMFKYPKTHKMLICNFL